MDLVGHIYAAVTKPQLWPAVLEGISARHRGAAVALHRQNLPAGIEDVVTCNMPDGAFEAFGASFAGAEQLEVNRSLPDLMIARPFSPEEFLGGEEAFLSHPVYTQVFRPFGLRYLACSLLYFEEHWGAAFSMARGAEQGPYLPDEMADLAQTLQHLSRAVSLRYALAAAERTSRILAETLNAFDRAAIVVSSDGTLRFANRLGETLLAKADGLRAEAGRVKPVARDEARTFQSLVAGCTMAGGPGPRAGGLMRIARVSGRPLQLVVSPLASSFGSDVERGLALVLVADPDRPPPDPRRLVTAHGLTGAEAAVAARLLIGETPADAAAALGLSITTVRFHLRNLKAKTGTHRQAELLLLLRETL